MVDITNNWSPVHTYPYSLENILFFLHFQKYLCPLVAFAPVHTYTHSRPQYLRVWGYARQLCGTLRRRSQNLVLWASSQRMLFYSNKNFFLLLLHFIAKVLCCFGIGTEEINGALEEFSRIQGSCCSCWENTFKSSQIWELKFAYAWQLIKYLIAWTT